MEKIGRPKTFRYHVLAGVVCTLGVSSPVAGALAGEVWARFPGHGDTLRAPRAGSVLVNVDQGTEPHHQLFLKRPGVPDALIHSYDRFVNVAWAPDGRALLLADHFASDESKCLVVHLAQQPKMIDVSEKISRQFAALPSLVGNHHVYCDGVKWLSAGQVRVKVHGYGDRDRDGFEMVFDYSLGQDTLVMHRKQ
jgi:hypothetical protein